MTVLVLLLGKIFSDPEKLPGVQQERERLRMVGSIAKAAYLMGFKDALVLVAIVVALGLLFFFLPRWLAGPAKQAAAPLLPPAPLPPGEYPRSDPLHPWGRS